VARKSIPDWTYFHCPDATLLKKLRKAQREFCFDFWMDVHDRGKKRKWVGQEGERDERLLGSIYRARLLLQALVVLPQGGELDDTHFERLKSRLLSYCQGSPQLLSSFLEIGAVNTIEVRFFFQIQLSFSNPYVACACCFVAKACNLCSRSLS